MVEGCYTLSVKLYITCNSLHPRHQISNLLSVRGAAHAFALLLKASRYMSRVRLLDQLPVHCARPKSVGPSLFLGEALCDASTAC